LIRNAEPADIEGILLIEKDNFTNPWSEVSFMNDFKKNNCEFLVWEISGEVAGFIIFWYILDEGEIGNIAVDRKYRRQGIAEKLINGCKLKHPEVSNIYLEVEETNTGAICLYNKLGFERTGFIKDYYGTGRNALRMSCCI
jgi:ribosomal-protein-alanine N-acetyltransferase